MQRRLALAFALLVLQLVCFATVAHAEDQLPCEAFARLGDGSWQAITTTLIPGHDFKAQEGSIWRPGATVLGIDIATTLEKECPNAPIGLPQGAALPGAPAAPALAGQPQQSQLPQVPLARYADANGSIDVRSLTCGHLDDAPAEDAEMLLIWYSGWYNGAAKGHGINLARVRYAVRNVIGYCRANRDKSLAQVMELMLK